MKDIYIEYQLSELVYAIFWGYKFDFAISAIVALLYSFFDFNKKLSAIVGSFLLMSLFLIQMSDILYFNESSRHTGYEIQDAFVDAGSLLSTAFSQHPLFSISSILLGGLIYLFGFKILSKLSKADINKSFIFKKLLLIAISIFFIRGMFQHIPLNPWQSNQIGDSKISPVAINASYNMFYSLVNKSKKLKPVKLKPIPDETIEKSFRYLYPESSTQTKFPIIDSKPNVVFLFLESWSAKNLKPYGFSKNTTPYFNEILEKSIRPTIMIAGGHRTTEGMFTTLASLQNPLGKSVAKTNLQDFKFQSIIDVFNDIGYASAFFQGTSKETSGTGSFAQTLGFKDSFGKRDIKKRIYEENYWGVYDQDLYNFVLNKLDSKIKEPFVIGINGATTHDHKIPAGVKKIEFVKDDDYNNRLNALHFSDLALKEFINKTQKLYPNTIFVLFADHCGGGISGSLQNNQIPFAIYSQKLIKEKKYNTIISQRDIAPTVYDLTIGDYTKSKLFSGKSLLRDELFFADYYHSGTLGWIEDEKSLEINIATESIKCFKMEGYNQTPTRCSKEYNLMKQNAMSFTTLSQKLLFSNKLIEFQEYRYQK
jgi:phosphoglycerol transferase MdoB-like AlkP superfamily enzyme